MECLAGSATNYVHFEARSEEGRSVVLKHSHKDGFDCHYLADPVIEAALQELLPDPDAAFINARIYKPGSRTHAARVVLAGHTFFLKRYNCRGVRYRIFNAFRPSRAWRTWNVTWTLVDEGLPVARPLIFLQERTMRLLGRSYILMDYVRDAGTLAETWPGATVVRKQAMLKTLADLLGRLHAKGHVHGDLKWTNILVSDKSGADCIELVDLDGARTGQDPAGRLVGKDLKRFSQDLVRYEEEIGLQSFFMDEWKLSFDRHLGSNTTCRCNE